MSYANIENKRHASLPDLISKLQQQEIRKQDLVVPASALQMRGGLLTINDVPDSSLSSELESLGVSTSEGTERELIGYEGTRSAHGQIASRLGIPVRYYRKMLENEEHRSLLDKSVNHWLSHQDKNFFVRSFKPTGDDGLGVLRAFLSERYKVIDNFDVLMTALDTIKDMGVNIEVEATDLTERQMNVRLVTPSIKTESRELLNRYRNPDTGRGGDYGIYSGLVLSNSETGAGTFSIGFRMVMSVCSNGMIAARDYSRRHLGARMEDEGVLQWSEQTKSKNMELISSQVEDAVRQYLSPEFLEERVKHLESIGTRRIENPVEALQNVCSNASFTEEETSDIVDYFAQSGDTSAFGAAQAVTYAAHEHTDADRQYEMEEEASSVMEELAREAVEVN